MVKGQFHKENSNQHDKLEHKYWLYYMLGGQTLCKKSSGNIKTIILHSKTSTTMFVPQENHVQGTRPHIGILSEPLELAR